MVISESLVDYGRLRVLTFWQTTISAWADRGQSKVAWRLCENHLSNEIPGTPGDLEEWAWTKWKQQPEFIMSGQYHWNLTDNRD